MLSCLPLILLASLGCEAKDQAPTERTEPKDTPTATMQPMNTNDTLGDQWAEQCKKEGLPGGRYGCCQTKESECTGRTADCSARYKRCIKVLRPKDGPEGPDFPQHIFTTDELEEIRRVDPGTN